MQKHKRIFIIITLISLVLTLGSVNMSALSTNARAACLIDADSGAILYSLNENERLPMASTTKIMSAIVALEHGDLNAVVKIDKKACDVEGSSVYLKEGEELTLSQLLLAMMLESANDSASAIAIHVGGSIEGFADMMNEKATELGLENTNFENPHGLDSENHYTTAKDLAILSAYAIKNPDFAKLVSTYKATIPMGESSHRYLLNHNKLLKQYDGAIGVKTGFTKKSGRCLVSAAQRNGITLVAVTLNCPDDWREHSAMLDYGFENYEKRELLKAHELEFTIECVNGTDKVKLTNENEVTALIKSTDSAPNVQIKLPRFVYAPVNEGDVLGSVEYIKDGTVIGKSDLVAQNRVKSKTYKKSLLEKLFK